MVLCEYQQKAEFDKLKIRAAFFGVNLEEDSKKKPKEQRKKGKKKEDVFMFKDPSEYENMSEEERKKLSEEMMSKHRQWSEGKLKKG